MKGESPNLRTSCFTEHLVAASTWVSARISFRSFHVSYMPQIVSCFLLPETVHAMFNLSTLAKRKLRSDLTKILPQANSISISAKIKEDLFHLTANRKYRY